MRHASWLLAYHGCDRKIGEEILSGRRELAPSRNDYDWLGTGAYFWQNSFSRAAEWADFMASSRMPAGRRLKAPFVIGAIIDPGNCLDLSEAGCLNVLRAAHGRFTKTVEASGWGMPRNEAASSSDRDLVKRKLDCAVINFLHEDRESRKEDPFDTVCCPFTEGGELFDGSRICAKTHIQWCVRSPEKSIRGYFLPRKVNG
jgi:hypothetical protein